MESEMITDEVPFTFWFSLYLIWKNYGYLYLFRNDDRYW